MAMSIGFYQKHFFAAVFIFVIEVAIALWVHDRLIRPFIGDALVVVLLFFMCKTVIKASDHLIILCVLAFSFAIEVGQYFNLAKLLGLADNKIAKTVIGSTFDYNDLVAYTMGAAILYAAVVVRKKWPANPPL